MREGWQANGQVTVESSITYGVARNEPREKGGRVLSPLLQALGHLLVKVRVQRKLLVQRGSGSAGRRLGLIPGVVEAIPIDGTVRPLELVVHVRQRVGSGIQRREDFPVGERISEDGLPSDAGFHLDGYVPNKDKVVRGWNHGIDRVRLGGRMGGGAS